MGDPGVKRIIYKRVTADDEKKLEARSNQAKSGGGARDVRFGPGLKFEPVLRRMFPGIHPNPSPKPKSGEDVLTGEIRWFNPGAEDESAHPVEIWPPYPSRSPEWRLGEATKVPPFSKDDLPDESEGAAFFLLHQDGNDAVWGRFVSEAELRSGAWNSQVADPIIARLEASSRGNIRGYFDFEQGTEEHFG